MDKLLETFCFVDDVCLAVDASLARYNTQLPANPRGPKPKLTTSEIVFILILFHQSSYRTFKAFYNEHVRAHMQAEFPHLVSYTRFVALQANVLLHLWTVLQALIGQSQQTGISFIDSTPLRVCHNKRAAQHKVFKGLAKKGKTSMGWFFGFKLHVCINDKGELLSFWLTQGNEHDTKSVERLTQGLTGKLYGDKGYISKDLTSQLAERGLQLITKLRKNMKPKLIQAYDALMLRKRAVVESVIDQLKNISQVEHSRYRSPASLVLNVFAALTAYCLQPKKPCVNLDIPAPCQDILVF